MGQSGRTTRNGARLVLEAQRLFDGSQFVEPPLLACVDGRVEAIGSAVNESPDVVLDGMSLLPGLVDCHQHLVFHGDGTLEDQVAGHPNEALLQRAREQARRALEGGVTTLRDLGDRDFVTLDLRGDPDLPTILCSGPPITPPGGHCWYLNGECPDRAALIAAVRERADRGCDVVKIMATGGNLTAAMPAWKSQFSAGDLRAVVDEAHRLGLPVAAHCHGVEGIANAIDAGVDTIEHCTFRTGDDSDPAPDLLERVAASGIPLSATWGRCPDIPVPTHALPAWLATAFESITRVRELGGRIVVGTDAGIFPFKRHDVAPHAIEQLLACGMQPVEALAALTSHGADAVGLPNKGRLKPGSDADIVAVHGDLLDDARHVADVAKVWRSGWPVTRQDESIGDR